MAKEGPTTRKHFTLGYQEALTDCVNAYIERGDANGVLGWIEDNLRDYDTRVRFLAAIDARNEKEFGA